MVARIQVHGDADLFGIAQTSDGQSFVLALARAGSKRPARMAIMAMTTSSSMSVNPFLAGGGNTRLLVGGFIYM